MSVKLTMALKQKLWEHGVETLHLPEHMSLPVNSTFEPPCSLKWMEPHVSLKLGAFSYGVGGYYFAVEMGRYVSVGEQV